jgi:carbamoyl-phosphate synthase large subunit
VIPVHDIEIEVIAANISSIPCRVAVSPSESVSLANDKLKCNQFFALSINVPYFGEEKFEKGEEVIVKPRRGVSSRGHFIGLWPLDEEFSSQDVIVQRRVSGVEYTVDVYRSFLGDVVKASVRERIATKDGQSVKGVIRAIPELEELSVSVATQLDLRGAINVQWIYDGKKFWFIEVNPRFAGAGILTYANGYNMPDWTIQELLFGAPIGAETGDLKINTHMSRYWEEYFVVT